MDISDAARARLRDVVGLFDALVDDWRDYPDNVQVEPIDSEVHGVIGRCMPVVDNFIGDDDPLADIVALLRSPPMTPQELARASTRVELTHRKVRTYLVMLLSKLRSELPLEPGSPALRAAQRRSLSVRIRDDAPVRRSSDERGRTQRG